MDDFKIWYSKEPELILGNSSNSFDPKIGIFNHSFYFEKETVLTPNQINIGIIGDTNSIDFARNWIEMLNNPITNDKGDPYLFPFFPGFNKLGVKLMNNKNWNRELSSRAIDNIMYKTQSGNK